MTCRPIGFLFQFALGFHRLQAEANELLDIDCFARVFLAVVVGTGSGNHRHVTLKILAAFSGTEIDAESWWLEVTVGQSAVGHRLAGCPNRIKDIGAGMNEPLGIVHVVRDREVLDLGGKPGWKVFGGKMRDRSDTVGATPQRVPHLFDIIAEWCHTSDACHHDTMSHSR